MTDRRLAIILWAIALTVAMNSIAIIIIARKTLEW